MTDRKKIDWEAMHADWAAGIKTCVQLSKEYGVSRAAIIKHWRKEGVERDLQAQIKARADALVTRATLQKSVTPENRVTDKEIIEANAQSIACVDLSHRSDVQRYRELVNKLASELTQQIEGHEEFEDLGEIMAAEATDKMREVYQRTIGFGGRTDNLKKLSDTLRMLVELERKILNLDQPEDTNKDQATKSVEVKFV